MGINVNFATSQANKVRNYGDTLRVVNNDIRGIKDKLNSNWKAEEINSINGALENACTNISSITSALDSLASDIIAVANEIKREEEAAKAAAEARAARLAAEKAAREKEAALK